MRLSNISQAPKFTSYGEYADSEHPHITVQYPGGATYKYTLDNATLAKKIYYHGTKAPGAAAARLRKLAVSVEKISKPQPKPPVIQQPSTKPTQQTLF